MNLTPKRVYIIFIILAVVLFASTYIFIQPRSEKIKQAFDDGCYRLRSEFNCANTDISFKTSFKQFQGELYDYTFFDVCKLYLTGSINGNLKYTDCIKECDCPI